MYLSLFFITLFICSILFLIEEHNQKWNVWAYTGLAVCLIFIAAFRPEGMDNDFDTYVSLINNNKDDDTIAVEWSFLFFSKTLMAIFDNYRSVFLFYAILGVSIKCIAMKKLSPSYFGPLCIYIGNFFIMHEFTQIRAGVAAAILLLATYYIQKKQRAYACTCILCATFFHYSSLAFMPILFMPSGDMNRTQRILWALLIPFGYILYFAHIQVTSLPIPYIEDKIEAYQSLRDIGFIDEVNVFNLLILLKIAVFYYLLYYYDYVKKINPAFPLCFRLMGLSLFMFCALSDLPVLSFRISELYGIVELVLFTAISYTILPKWLGKLATISLAFALLILHAFIDNILVIM